MKGVFFKYFLWRRSLCWILFAVLFASVLTQIPLFGVLGFEFSFALSPLAAIGGGHLALGIAKKTRKHFQEGTAKTHSQIRIVFYPVLSTLILSSFLLLVPPFLILLVATLIGDSCNLWEGIGFFVMGPCLSLVWGISIGYTIGVSITSPRMAGLFFALVCLFRFLFSVAWFLFQPPIFAYNPLVGFFPGSLYDEQIEIEAPYLWFRLGNLLESLGLLVLLASFLSRTSYTLVRKLQSNFATCLWGIFFLFASLSLALFSGFFGFRLSANTIQKRLGGFVETTHFRIFYSKNSQMAEQIDLIADDHEFRYAQIFKIFKEASPGKIDSYIYGSFEEKHVLFGTRVTQFAKPWLKQIHLNASNHPHPVLKHELVHVMAGAFSDWPFRTAGRYSILVNVGLIEGLATAIDFRSQDLDPHQWSAAMRRLGLTPPIENLFSPTGFFSSTAGLSYTLSGSFVRFLLDTYGIEKLKKAYRTGDLKDAYQKPLSSLTTEWERFLDSFTLSENALSVAKARFDRPSIFSKICAHEQAVLRAKARNAFAEKDFSKGVRFLETLVKLDPDNPRNMQSIALAYAEANDLEKSQKVALELLMHSKLHKALAGEILHFLGDISFRQGFLEEARRRYAHVYSLHLSEDIDRLLEVKISALDQSSTWEGMRTYFFSGSDEGEMFLSLRELWARNPEYAPVPYLLGRQLFFRGAYLRAIPYLEASLRLNLPGNALKREALFVLGSAQALSGQLYEASRTFLALRAGDHPAALTWEALDWMERILWELES